MGKQTKSKYVYKVVKHISNFEVYYISENGKDGVLIYDEQESIPTVGSIIDCEVIKNKNKTVKDIYGSIKLASYGVVSYYRNSLVILSVDYYNDDTLFAVSKEYDISKFINKKCKIWYSNINFIKNIKLVISIEHIDDNKKVDPPIYANLINYWKMNNTIWRYYGITSIKKKKVILSGNIKIHRLDPNFNYICYALSQSEKQGTWFKSRYICHIVPIIDNYFSSGKIKYIKETTDFIYLTVKENDYVINKQNYIPLVVGNYIYFEYIYNDRGVSKIIKFDLLE